MPFYKVTGGKYLQIVEHFDIRKKVRRKALKWAKQYGGTDLLTSSIQDFRYSGIIAEECPGLDWCHCVPKSNRRHEPTWWRPRRTKNGKLIIAEMHEFRIPSSSDLHKIIGFKPSFLERVGYTLLKKKQLFVFETPKKTPYKPTDYIERISDIEYEKLIAKPRRKNRK